MKIEVLGTGCRNCVRLYERTQKAVGELNLDAEIVKVEDIAEILKRGVMKTPGLVVDGKVVMNGRVPSVDEIKGYLK